MHSSEENPFAGDIHEKTTLSKKFSHAMHPIKKTFDDKMIEYAIQNLSLGNIFLMVLVPICWSTVGVPRGTVIGPPIGIPIGGPISKFYYLSWSRSQYTNTGQINDPRGIPTAGPIGRGVGSITLGPRFATFFQKKRLLSILC